jgi:hypothetical protein
MIDSELIGVLPPDPCLVSSGTDLKSKIGDVLFEKAV